MVDGSVLDNKWKLREHNKRNDVIDVGNDSSMTRESRPELDLGGLREDLHRAWGEHDV